MESLRTLMKSVGSTYRPTLSGVYDGNVISESSAFLILSKKPRDLYPMQFGTDSD